MMLSGDEIDMSEPGKPDCGKPASWGECQYPRCQPECMWKIESKTGGKS